MARRGGYNPNQPRDSNGRWTAGRGGSRPTGGGRSTPRASGHVPYTTWKNSSALSGGPGRNVPSRPSAMQVAGSYQRQWGMPMGAKAVSRSGGKVQGPALSSSLGRNTQRKALANMASLSDRARTAKGPALANINRQVPAGGRAIMRNAPAGAVQMSARTGGAFKKGKYVVQGTAPRPKGDFTLPGGRQMTTIAGYAVPSLTQKLNSGGRWP